MEVKGLKEPAIHFFESLLRKRKLPSKIFLLSSLMTFLDKKEGLEEMIQRRVFPVLIEVIYDPNADEVSLFFLLHFLNKIFSPSRVFGRRLSKSLILAFEPLQMSNYLNSFIWMIQWF
jgi:hypothetical protein